jgi:hypothetical protein
MWVGLSGSREMMLRCILEGKSILDMHTSGAIKTSFVIVNASLYIFVCFILALQVFERN